MNQSIPRHFSAFRGELSSLFGFAKDFVFLDLTLGDGGHTQEALDAGCRVVSFDVDEESISRATGFLENSYKPLLINDFYEFHDVIPESTQWIVIKSNFVNALEATKKLNLGPFQGIMVDLGPSQYQVLSEDRGFSFNSDSILDMRLDKNLGVTAKDLLAVLNEGELRELLELADEPYARVIARNIVRQRSIAPIQTGLQLSSLVVRSKGGSRGKIHPATQVFMALRMAVNLERENITNIISQVPELLAPGGKVGIISFHSGEDLIVKSLFNQYQSENKLVVINKKPILPSTQELTVSNRTRSAKIRLAQKHI